jgi:Flp pilus assembly protein TadB
MRWGVDWRTVVLGLAALGLAVGLGAWAGTEVGVWAGVLAALAGLLPPAVLAVAIGRRQRNMARVKKQKAIIRKHAPPKRTGNGER